MEKQKTTKIEIESSQNINKVSLGCGREWTESACVKTEPDYCGEGDNLCPKCSENAEEAKR